MTEWTPTRSAALERLEDFVPKAGRAYARLRNHDLGPGNHDHVSRLSPWIRHRVLLEEEVVAAVLDHHSFSAAEKFIQEVFWRTYWKGWLELRPQVWDDYRDRVYRLLDDLDEDEGFRSRWEAATEGRTGIESFDTWAKELVETGYVHNHARMWFASIWIFTLELPWELGADFFLRHLLDGDPASNTLSWRWVAGLQTRGKTYLARPDNIAKYTEGRFKPAHGLSSTAVAVNAPAPPAPTAAPRHVAWDTSQPTGLLITEEDLSPEFVLATGADIRGAIAISASERRSPLGTSSRAMNFVDGAIDDLEHRLGDRLWLSRAAGPMPESIDAIADWARSLEVRQIVTPYAPVGPTREGLRLLSARLAEAEISLVPVLRRYDEAAWPHATRGFFPFREKIPTILREIQTDRARAA